MQSFKKQIFVCTYELTHITFINSIFKLKSGCVIKMEVEVQTTLKIFYIWLKFPEKVFGIELTFELKLKFSFICKLVIFKKLKV